ncbi:MAG: hypothetical protein ABI051_13110 [Vicinamibacterales bacterium]
MAQRLEEAAGLLERRGPVPFTVLYDIGYPHTPEELSKMGAAVLLVTAVSQNENELPVKRASVVEADRSVELRPLQGVLYKDPDEKSRISRVLGRYRADALYLLPIQFRLKQADLFVEFTGSLASQKIGTFGTPISPQVAAMLSSSSNAGTLDEKFLSTFIRREYPGFFE